MFVCLFAGVLFPLGVWLLLVSLCLSVPLSVQYAFHTVVLH